MVREPSDRLPTDPSPRLVGELRRLTPARVALGRSGASVPTKALLDFALDHARARDAVHAAFHEAAIAAELSAMKLAVCRVASCARNRKDYLLRPDRGRMLDEASRRMLASLDHRPCDLAIVVGDGLSPSAVHAHGIELVRRLVAKLIAARIDVGPVVLASGARVALGDDIGALVKARMVVVLIGERPGLSAPRSLGAYLTFAPKPGLSDASRNCVSNIHAAGLSYDEAASKIAWLVRQSLARQMSGVGLKDESAAQMRLHTGPDTAPA